MSDKKLSMARKEIINQKGSYRAAVLVVIGNEEWCEVARDTSESQCTAPSGATNNFHAPIFRFKTY